MTSMVAWTVKCMNGASSARACREAVAPVWIEILELFDTTTREATLDTRTSQGATSDNGKR
jgi:hypothetical protein